MSPPRALAPEYLCRKFRQGARRGSFRAAVLLVDVSGFTTLTEALMQHGKPCAEVLTRESDDRRGYASARGNLGECYPGPMDEATLNMAIRRFLKDVGVTSQREIESAVRDALQSDRLDGSEKLTARAVITIDGLKLHHEVTGEIALE